MSNTTFVNQSTVVEASWLNDVNDTVYEVLGDGTNTPTTKAQARTNLGASATGDALFTAVSTAAARTSLGAAASGANTDITSLNAPAIGAATATTQAVNTNNTTVATTAFTVAQINNRASNTVPLANGTAAAGTALPYAREDHIHTAQVTATGAAPIYGCRAWVNFNGTGTVAIRASGNVSSITDNGAGDYTINFTTAMLDANYAVIPGAFGLGASVTLRNPLSQTTSAVRITVSSSSDVTVSSTPSTVGVNPILGDSAHVHVAIFR